MGEMIPKEQMKVTVEVEVISPDGKVKASSKSEREIPDLILLQFRDLLATLMTGRPSAPPLSRSVSLRDVANTLKTLVIYGDPAIHKIFNSYEDGALGGRLGIGSDATAPARTDYELIAKTAEFDITFEATTVDTIVKRGAWLATAGGTVRETAYYIYLRDSTPAVCEFLLFRDTPTPVDYDVDDSVRVQYTITL